MILKMQSVEAADGSTKTVAGRYVFNRARHKHNGASVVLISINREHLTVASYSNVISASFGRFAEKNPKLKTWKCKAEELN